MSKPVVFVIGASGNVGSATISSLSAKYADKVEIRAGVRNPEKADKLQAIPNVQIVQATMGDSNLVSVLAGVSTLYIVTPATQNRAELAVSTAEYAKQAGVKHIAVVSVPTADLPNTIFGGQLAEVEEKVSKLGVPYTIVRLPMFVDNYLSMRGSIVGQGMVYNPTDPDKPVAAVVVEDIGKASAAILVNPERHANETITIVGFCHTFNDFIRELSEALGKEIKYVRVPYEAAKKGMMAAGMQEFQVEGMVELFKLIDASSPTVTESHSGVYKDLTGEEPMSLKQWVAKHAGQFQ